jgi:hypothetical protein
MQNGFFARWHIAPGDGIPIPAASPFGAANCPQRWHIAPSDGMRKAVRHGHFRDGAY